MFKNTGANLCRCLARARTHGKRFAALLRQVMWLASARELTVPAVVYFALERFDGEDNSLFGRQFVLSNAGRLLVHRLLESQDERIGAALTFDRD